MAGRRVGCRNEWLDGWESNKLYYCDGMNAVENRCVSRIYHIYAKMK